MWGDDVNALLLTVLSLSSVVAMVTLTVTRSSIFKAFRDWVDERTCKDVNAQPSKLYELVKCPFCFSFWVTLVALMVFRAWREHAPTWDARLAMVFAVWCVACFLAGHILKLYERGGFKDE